MPIIDVTIIEGRPREMKAALIAELTDAAVRTLDAPIEVLRRPIETTVQLQSYCGPKSGRLEPNS